MHLKPEFINAPNSSFLNFAITSALQSSWCLLSTMERCHCVACTPVPYSKLSHIGVGAWSCPWWKGLLRRHWPMLNVSGCVCGGGGCMHLFRFLEGQLLNISQPPLWRLGCFVTILLAPSLLDPLPPLLP